MTTRILVASTLGLAACPSADEPLTPQPVELRFRAVVDGETAACGVDLSAGTPATGVQLADARLFVSRVQLREAGGPWVDLTLDEGGSWQHGGVALLDFEDGTASCSDSGTAETNAVVTGTLPSGVWDAVRFDLGVPEALNHADSATAPAPLDVPGMFWVWQSGYKFARVDFLVDGETPARWNVHLGSTGCASAAPTVAPDGPCTHPNRATITVEGFDPGSDEVVVDLGALVRGADLTADTLETPPGCMSSPTEPLDCTPTFAAVGLDFGTGVCVSDCDGQTVFAAETR